jgi:hypothetical protein
MQPSAENAAARAERLRVVLAFCAGMPYLDPSEAGEQGRTPLSPADLTVLAQPITDDDLALANACLEVEADFRQRGYAAVERLLATVAGTQGNLRERVVRLPHFEALRALGDLSDVGWIYRTPE